MPTNAELEASLKTANGKIRDLEGEIDKLKASAAGSAAKDEDLRTANGKIRDLEDQLKAADLTHARQVAALQEEITAAGVAIAPGSEASADVAEIDFREVTRTTQRYDSIYHGRHGDDWEFVERHRFIEDSGYSDGLRDRSIATVIRAFEPTRLGDVLRGVGQSYNRLPPFKRGHLLEVSVRLIPQEG